MKSSPFDPHRQHLHTDHKIVVALEKVTEAFRVLLWKESTGLSLSPIQIQILIFLRFHEAPMRKVSYLATEFNLTKATVSDTVRTLLQKGLVTKTADPADTRSFVLHLTETGRELAGRTARFAEAIRQPVAGLGEDEKQALLAGLISIIDHLSSSGVISLQRMCFSCSQYEGTAGGGHFCRLLERRLDAADLRLDCPEHEALAV